MDLTKLILAVALIPAIAFAESTTIDDFEGDQLSPLWTTTITNASGASVVVVNGELSVTGYQGAGASPRVAFQRNMLPSTGDFTWQSAVRWNDSTGTVFNGTIRALRCDGSVAASVAVVDVWSNSTGTFQGFCEGLSWSGSQNSLPSSGVANLKIARRDGVMRVFSNDNILLEAASSSEICRIELVSSYPNSAGAPLGLLTFQQALLVQGEKPCIGDVNSDDFVNFDDLNILLANWGDSCD